jgi:hypothetical protein
MTGPEIGCCDLRHGPNGGIPKRMRARWGDRGPRLDVCAIDLWNDLRHAGLSRGVDFCQVGNVARGIFSAMIRQIARQFFTTDLPATLAWHSREFVVKDCDGRSRLRRRRRLARSSLETFPTTFTVS